MASIFDAPTVPPLRTVLKQVEQGELLIPRFQRPFVWKDEQRLELLDSVARGLPIGSLLVWRTRRHKLNTYASLGPFKVPQQKPDGPWTYLIDGHQRLTTLYGALSRPDALESTETEARWPIFVDLEPEAREGESRDEPQFVLPRARPDDRPTLVPAWVLLDSRAVFEHQKQLWEVGKEGAATRLEELANRIKEYPLPVVPMTNESLADVTRAFTRINKSGTRMSNAHMAVALAYEKLPLEEELGQLAAVFSDMGWRVVDQATLIDLLMIRFRVDVYKGDLDTLLGHLGARENDAALFKSILEDVRSGLEAAIDVLGDAGVRGGEALPYRFQLLLLADVLREAPRAVQDPATRKQAIRWFWQTTFTEQFTGATGSTIRRQRAALAHALLVNPWGALPFEHSVVHQEERQKRWGAVRTLARLLAALGAIDHPDARRAESLLGEQGGDAVHKVLPVFETDRSGSYVVASADELRRLREEIARTIDRGAQGVLLDLRADIPTLGQFSQEAQDALLDGQLERFVFLRDWQLFVAEKRKIEEVGLVPGG